MEPDWYQNNFAPPSPQPLSKGACSTGLETSCKPVLFNLFQDEDGDDDDDEEIPLDMEEVEAASKKARQDEDIHSEHVQVNDKTLNQRNSKHIC